MLEEACGLKEGRESERMRPSPCAAVLFSLRLATSHTDD